MISLDDDKKKFAKRFEKRVKGKKIIACGYTSDNFPYLHLDDGSVIFIQQDDEGNGAGVAGHEFTKPGSVDKSGEVITTYLPEIF